MLALFTVAGLLQLVSNLSFLIMIWSIMVISGIMKAKGILEPIYSILTKYISNKKLLIAFLTTIFQPLPNRTVLTAAILDGMVDKNKDNTKIAALAYIATHHYYLWSPLEQSVIIAMAGLGISYATFMGYMIVPLLIYMLFVFGFLLFFVRNDELGDVIIKETEPQMSWSKRIDFLALISLIALNSFGILPVAVFGALTINSAVWSTLFYSIYLIVKHLPSKEELNTFVRGKLFIFATMAIILGWVIAFYSNPLTAFIQLYMGSNGIWFGALLGFIASFLFAKSARYAAFTVLLSTIFGMKFFVLFYIADMVGFMISPVHHTLIIVQQYFNAKFKTYYKMILCIATILILTAILMVI